MHARHPILNDAAAEDLKEIWDYVADRSGPRAAIKLVSEILDAFDDLALAPGMGHERPDVRDREYRFCHVHSHVIAYRFDHQAIRIGRVVHGSRDLRRINFP